VVATAAAFGGYREVKRIERFRNLAYRYQNEEQSRRAEGEELLRRDPESKEGAESIRKTDDSRELSRWYSTHALWGGSPPPASELEERLHAGWPIAEAYQRAGVVVVGKVVRIGWTGSDVTLRVQKVLKGEPKESDVVNISTRYVPYKAARLKRGDEWLAFYVEDPTYGNPAMQMFEKTAENLKALGVETP